MTDITIPGMGVGARNRLISVTIPASVTSIGTGAFAGNSRLKEILCDAGNTAYTSIDGVLFSKDGKTLVVYPAGKGTAYTIPASVTSIGESAFYGDEP